MTSSKTNKDPFSVVNSLKPSKKPGSGVIKPALPTIGSRITPEIASGFSENNFFTASKSL